MLNDLLCETAIEAGERQFNEEQEYEEAIGMMMWHEENDCIVEINGSIPSNNIASAGNCA